MKPILTDVQFLLKINHHNPDSSVLTIVFYKGEEKIFKCKGDVFENFYPENIPKKALFIKYLEMIEEELKNDEFGNFISIGINHYNSELIFKYDIKKNQVIVKEKRKTIGYFLGFEEFLSLLYKQLNNTLLQIKKRKISKDF
ncbi:hypothetical protein P4K82_29240 [Bacillus cereus]|nr:hypothetical protein [Bacillus cereus]